MIYSEVRPKLCDLTTIQKDIVIKELADSLKDFLKNNIEITKDNIDNAKTAEMYKTMYIYNESKVEISVTFKELVSGSKPPKLIKTFLYSYNYEKWEEINYPLKDGEIVKLSIPAQGYLFIKSSDKDPCAAVNNGSVTSANIGLITKGESKTEFGGDITSLIGGEDGDVELPPNAFHSLFSGSCESMVKAPNLPATHLTENCYAYLFTGCKTLAEIKAMSTDELGRLFSPYWTSQVSSIGNFTKKSGVRHSIGVNGIPRTWDIHEID